MHRSWIPAAVAAVVLTIAPIATAQANVGVIDVERVVRDSAPGKEAIADLREFQQQRVERGQQMQQELQTLQEQFQKQQLTLTQEKLDELGGQIEDRQIALKRFQEDAGREVEEMRRRSLDALEAEILAVVDEVGQERGLELIFKKFQSGLVYAAPTVEITDEVIRRYNLQQ